MSKRNDGQARGKYTLEFKLEAVRLVKGGQAAAVTAKVLGIPNQTPDNWVRLSNKGQLKGAGDKPVSPEQMELARLRAQLARVTMERDILKKMCKELVARGTPFADLPAHWRFPQCVSAADQFMVVL
ncbi:MAG: transposase [Rhodoferax sp.]|jgi:transposase-like protein|nr:transposase [Rhodoferax sp.]MBP9735556.1 transposase [Rhodoferax sp.]